MDLSDRFATSEGAKDFTALRRHVRVALTVRQFAKVRSIASDWRLPGKEQSGRLIDEAKACKGHPVRRVWCELLRETPHIRVDCVRRVRFTFNAVALESPVLLRLWTIPASKCAGAGPGVSVNPSRQSGSACLNRLQRSSRIEVVFLA